MNLSKAIEMALETGGWVKTPEGPCFVVGYLPHYKETDTLSPTPLDRKHLHCILISRRTGKIPSINSSDTDIYYDVKFTGNDFFKDYQVVTSLEEQAKIVHDYNVEINNRRDSFLKEMPGSLKQVYKEIYPNDQD